jgi:glutamine synthetase
MSVYLGSQLESLFNQIATGKIGNNYSHKGEMIIGVDTLPPLSKDAGDRNRTSPFAFTGNRFEFRAVGSSQSVSGPLITLNTMLADSLTWVGDLLESELGKGIELNTAIVTVLQQVMQKHGTVIFGGDGYSAEWHKMAVEERGLANLPTTADALPVLKEKYIEDLFEKTGVLSPVELESRYEVYAEQYILSIEVEAKLVIDMAKTMIYPAAIKHLANVSQTVAGLEGMGIKLDQDNVKKVAELTNSMMSKVSKLISVMTQSDFGSTEEHMKYCATTILPLMNDIREDVDALEAEVANDLWPLPTYQEMLFIK